MDDQIVLSRLKLTVARGAPIAAWNFGFFGRRSKVPVACRDDLHFSGGEEVRFLLHEVKLRGCE